MTNGLAFYFMAAIIHCAKMQMHVLQLNLNNGSYYVAH